MLPQDLAVAFQGMLFASAFGSIPGVGGWAAPVSGAVLAAFVCLYLMIDQILLASCSFRLRYYFASHLVRIIQLHQVCPGAGRQPGAAYLGAARGDDPRLCPHVRVGRAEQCSATDFQTGLLDAGCFWRRSAHHPVRAFPNRVPGQQHPL